MQRESADPNPDSTSEEQGWIFAELRCKNWDEARRIGRLLGKFGWVFRGQTNASWSLSTNLERVAERFNCPPSFSSQIERWSLRQFQRRAHHFISDSPSPENPIEWLALIQHHGGPTRLLDFTHSFYVAVFFAVENADDDSAVWGIHLDKLNRAIASNLGMDFKDKVPHQINSAFLGVCNKVLRNGADNQLVLSVEPERMNERSAVQQGLFMFPLEVSVPFETNLAVTFRVDKEVLAGEENIAVDRKDVMMRAILGSIVKIVIPKGSRKEALDDLHSMNITAASLFPGLDGFARSLQYYFNVLGASEAPFSGYLDATEMEWLDFDYRNDFESGENRQAKT